MWNIILDFDGRFWCTDVKTLTRIHVSSGCEMKQPSASKSFCFRIQ